MFYFKSLNLLHVISLYAPFNIVVFLFFHRFFVLCIRLHWCLQQFVGTRRRRQNCRWSRTLGQESFQKWYDEKFRLHRFSLPMIVNDLIQSFDLWSCVDVSISERKLTTILHFSEVIKPKKKNNSGDSVTKVCKPSCIFMSCHLLHL